MLTLYLETLWADFVLYNPLDTEVELWDFTVVVQEAANDDATSAREYLDIEVIDKITMKGMETRTVGCLNFFLTVISCNLPGTTSNQGLTARDANTLPTDVPVLLPPSMFRIPRYQRPTAQRHTDPEARQGVRR